MKKIIQLVLFCIFLLIGYGAQAQFSIGYRGGVLGSMLKRSESSATHYFKFGGFAELVGEYRFNEVFAVQGGVGMSQKGGKSTEIVIASFFSAFRRDVKEDINYVDFFVMAKGGIRKGPIRIDVLTGPSYGRAHRGSVITTTTPAVGFSPNWESIKFDNDFKRIDVSWQTGMALSIYVRRAYIFGEARYQHGLSNLNADVNSLVEIKSRSIVVSLGVMFKL